MDTKKEAVLGRREFLLAGASVAALPLLAMPAISQAAFPKGPIELIIHSGAGGGADITAHALIREVRSLLGWDIALVRKTGAAGAVAHEYLVSRPKDGHTVLGFTGSQTATLARGKSKIKMDDLVGVAQATLDPSFIMVNAKSPIKTAQDYIAAAKERAISLGTTSIGGGDHITGFLLAQKAGLKPFNVVPIVSGGEIAINIVGGNIDSGFLQVTEADAQIRAGEIRPILGFTESRSPAAPDVAVAKELGLDIVRPTLRGYSVLRGTPDDVVKILRDGFLKALQAPSFQDYLKNAGMEPNSVQPGDVFEKTVRDEYDDSVTALTALGLM